MTIINAIPYTTFDHPNMEITETIRETNYPTLHYLLTLYSGTRPHHPAITLNKDFHIPPTFKRQVKILETLISPLTDEELRALANLRGFDAYVRTIHAHNLYLLESFLDNYI